MGILYFQVTQRVLNRAKNEGIHPHQDCSDPADEFSKPSDLGTSRTKDY